MSRSGASRVRTFSTWLFHLTEKGRIAEGHDHMAEKKLWTNNYFRFKDAIQQLNLKGSAKSVLRALNDHADENGKLWVSYATIAKESGVSLSTAIRGIQALEILDLIQVTRDMTRSRDSDVNRYQLKLANIRLIAESQGCRYTHR